MSSAAFDDLPNGTTAGTPYTGWLYFDTGCVFSPTFDIPSRRRQTRSTRPSPPSRSPSRVQLPTPDIGLVNLPEMFYPTEATDQQLTFDIRGFSVTPDTDVTQFNW